MDMQTAAELAREIATSAHAGQFRRDGVTPYITHPESVASRVAGDPILEATAWLHDVLEDTDETSDSLAKQGIPADVIHAVELLTKNGEGSYDDYLNQVLTDATATQVKVADMLSNLADNPTRAQIRKYAYGLLKLVPDNQ